MLIFLILAAILPALLLVRYFVRKDRFPEPTHLLVKTFLLGIGITIPAALVGLPLMIGAAPLEDTIFYPILMAFVAAGLTEEGLKLLVLHFYCATRRDFAPEGHQHRRYCGCCEHVCEEENPEDAPCVELEADDRGTRC